MSGSAYFWLHSNNWLRGFIARLVRHKAAPDPFDASTIRRMDAAAPTQCQGGSGGLVEQFAADSHHAVHRFSSQSGLEDQSPGMASILSYIRRKN
jgi:hypothetical protein